jgi:uncharacterized protein (DUF2147 family)
MKHALVAIVLGAMALPALAQSTPVGLWRNYDDKTGEAKAEVRITETAGVLSGKVEKRLLKNARPEDLCTECSDDRKDKLVLGMEVIRGAKKADDREVWEGGKILDPENGRNYTLKMTPIEGGKKLEVRGSFGPFGRTQTWVRLQ